MKLPILCTMFIVCLGILTTCRKSSDSTPASTTVSIVKKVEPMPKKSIPLDSAVLEEIPMINHGGDTVNIPRLKDPKHPINSVIDKMNAAILDEFCINSYNDSDSVNLWFQDVKTTICQEQGILYLEYEGVSQGAYPVEGTWGLFFDMKTGDTISATEFPCQAFFTLDGYDQFIRKYWRSGAEKAFDDATVCAGSSGWSEGSGDRLYDMEYEMDSLGNVVISLPYTIFPHVVQACSPEYSVTLSNAKLKPYLNDIGKEFLTREYLSKSPLKQFIQRRMAMNTIPSNLFVFGEIDCGYPITMALHFEPDSTVTGFYSHNPKGKRILLNGRKEGIKVMLNETVQGKESGHFSLVMDTASYVDGGFSWSDMNFVSYYLTGTRSNTAKSEGLPIRFTAIEGTKI